MCRVVRGECQKCVVAVVMGGEEQEGSVLSGTVFKQRFPELTKILEPFPKMLLTSAS